MQRATATGELQIAMQIAKRNHFQGINLWLIGLVSYVHEGPKTASANAQL